MYRLLPNSMFGIKNDILSSLHAKSVAIAREKHLKLVTVKEFSQDNKAICV